MAIAARAAIPGGVGDISLDDSRAGPRCLEIPSHVFRRNIDLGDEDIGRPAEVYASGSRTSAPLVELVMRSLFLVDDPAEVGVLGVVAYDELVGLQREKARIGRVPVARQCADQQQALNHFLLEY